MRSILTLGLSRRILSLFLAAFASLSPRELWPEQVTVHQIESSFHGYLIVRNQAGAAIGSAEVVQAPHKGHMSVSLVLRFKDGSIDDETTEYSQDRTFHLIRDRHIQRGPFFPHPIDTSIDMASGQVKSVQPDKGPGSGSSEQMDLPQDLANGIAPTLIKNLENFSKEVKVSYLAFSPKPRLVKLAISSVGEQSFKIAGHAFAADHYVVKIDLGGIAGVVAPLVGKQPSDVEVWTSTGKVPTVVRVDGALYLGGPIISLQLAAPSW